jgi:hypothetical protein
MICGGSERCRVGSRNKRSLTIRRKPALAVTGLLLAFPARRTVLGAGRRLQDPILPRLAAPSPPGRHVRSGYRGVSVMKNRHPLLDTGRKAQLGCYAAVPGTGPAGALCSGCVLLVPESSKFVCTKYRALAGRKGKAVSPSPDACRSFEQRRTFRAGWQGAVASTRRLSAVSASRSHPGSLLAVPAAAACEARNFGIHAGVVHPPAAAGDQGRIFAHFTAGVPSVEVRPSEPLD